MSLEEIRGKNARRDRKCVVQGTMFQRKCGISMIIIIANDRPRFQHLSTTKGSKTRSLSRRGMRGHSFRISELTIRKVFRRPGAGVP